MKKVHLASSTTKYSWCCQDLLSLGSRSTFEIEKVTCKNCLKAYGAFHKRNYEKNIFDNLLLEMDNGKAVYYHNADCESFCEFACNGKMGFLIAEAYNAGSK